MTEKSVYLAGPIIGLDYKGATDWRDCATRELAKHGIVAYSPLRYKRYLEDQGIMGAPDSKTPITSPQAVHMRDKNDVRRRDMMLVNFLEASEISRGTFIEYGLADAFGKPVVTVIESSGNPNDYHMANQISLRVETLEDGVSVAKAILNP